MDIPFAEINPPHPKGSVNWTILVIVGIALMAIILLPLLFLAFQPSGSKENQKEETSNEPSEAVKKSRDTQRQSDAETLVTTLKLYLANNPTDKLPLGPYCSPKNSPTATQRAVDGTGWLPLNINQGSTANLLPVLPSDPDPSNLKRYIYRADNNGNFEISIFLESSFNAHLSSKDGGNDPVRLEAGLSVILDTRTEVCTESVSTTTTENDLITKADVNQAASIIEACLTKELSLKQPEAQIYSTTGKGCGNTSYLVGEGHYARAIPARVKIGANSKETLVCVMSQNGASIFWYSSDEGQVTSQKPANCPI